MASNFTVWKAKFVSKMEGFYKTFVDLFETIEESIAKERIVPALILIYSGIDGISSLADRRGRANREIFKAWVKKWMLEKYSLPCNEADIYAARCGLLHQQISESDMSRKKEARKIYYSWGNSEIKLLELTIKHSGKENECVAVKVEDLLWSYRNGFIDCFDMIRNDKDWKMVFEQNAQKSFATIFARKGV